MIGFAPPEVLVKPPAGMVLEPGRRQPALRRPTRVIRANSRHMVGGEFEHSTGGHQPSVVVLVVEAPAARRQRMSWVAPEQGDATPTEASEAIAIERLTAPARSLGYHLARRVRKLDSDGDDRKAAFEIFELFNGLLMSAAFRECDQAVLALSTVTLSTTTRLAVLSITLAAKRHLPSRSIFYRETERLLRESRPEDVEALLRGLD